MLCPFNEVIVAWRQRPDGIGVRLEARQPEGPVVDQRHFATAPEAGKRGLEFFRSIDLPGSEVPRRAAARDHIMPACPMAAAKPRRKARPPPGRIGAVDLPQHIAEQHCRATEAIAQRCQSFVRRETVERLEAQRRAGLPAAQNQARQGIGLECDHLVEAREQALWQGMPRARADNKQPPARRLPALDPAGQRGAKRRPQRLPVAQGAQVVAEPTRSVNKMIGSELHGGFDGGPVAQVAGPPDATPSTPSLAGRAGANSAAWCAATLAVAQQTARSAWWAGQVSPIHEAGIA